MKDLCFDDRGLIPVVVQDASDGSVLMLAWANALALERTVETGLAHFFSRSRDRLWQKGGTSGHVQRIVEIRKDCDADALLYRVEQVGGACHKGFASCFFRRLEDGKWTVDGERAFDPETVYGPDHKTT